MAVAPCHRSLAKLAERTSLRFSWVLDLWVPAIIQTARTLKMLVVIGTIAAAGRSGVEEMYGVPYLDVGCDVCFHVA
jgi:hypothetical protein